jgi:ketosteroid isomerase-like protein
MTVGRHCAALLAALIFLPTFAQSAVDPAVEQITRLEQVWNDAYGANDLKNYFSYYADDPVLVFYNERTTLAEYRKSWAESTKTEPLESAKISDLKVKVGPSGSAAIASYQLEVRTHHADGKTTTEHAFETDVWFKRKGAWRVTAVHYSTVPAK